MMSDSPNYKWLILIVGSIFHFTFTAAWIFVPVIKEGFATELGLDPFQIFWIYSVPILAIVIFVFLGGVITDKIGSRNATIISGILITLFGFLRGLSGDFTFLFITSFLFGAGGGLLFPNLAKIVADWFADEKKGTASGIYLFAGGFGQVISLSLTVAVILPLFQSNWRFCFIFYGALTLIGAVLWIIFAKEKEGIKKTAENLFTTTTLKQILTNRYILGLCVIIFFAFSMLAGFTFYMQEFVAGKGFSNGIYGYLASILSLGTAIGNISFPTLSDRVGKRKVFLIYCTIIAVVLLILLHLINTELTIWLLFFFLGLMVGTLIPICLTISIEVKSLPEELAGTISGLVLTFGFLGAFTATLIFGALLAITGIFMVCIIYLIFIGVIAFLLGFLQQK